MEGSFVNLDNGLLTKPEDRSPKSIDLEDEEELDSIPLKSNGVYSGSVSTTNSSVDVLEGIPLANPTKKGEQQVVVTLKERPSTKKSSFPYEEAYLGKRSPAFMSLAYLSTKCLEINREHALFEALISTHFDQSQKRLQKIHARLSGNQDGI